MSVLRLTNSEMKEYRRCKRKWWLSTYRRLAPRAPELPNTPLSIGNLVHDALANYYDPQARTDPVEYAERWAQTQIELNPETEVESTKEIELVRAMLSGYLEWLGETGADADIEVLGVERQVEVALVDGVNLLTKLDAPIQRRSDGAKLAFEHKTVASLDQPFVALKHDTQLLTEHLGLFLDARSKGATNEEAYEQCHGILYNMLRKVKRTASAKPPFYGREDAPHNLFELRAHWHHVVAIAAEITTSRAALDAGQAHHAVVPPNPTRDCKWDCPFFKMCVMLDDGSDAEGALHDLYEERDPLRRYEGSEPL
jgi:hypothetical protein